MNKPKYYNGRPIIVPGEIYDVEGTSYKVITATSEIIDAIEGSLNMAELVFLLENVLTKKRISIKESELESKF